MRYIKRIISYFLLLSFFATIIFNGYIVTLAEDTMLEINSNAAILMEASTGKIIYEKNSDERVSPASITKIMTLLLIFEELDEGKIALSDEVTTSAYAKSMGGSQVFLEEGEIQSVETLIKCIVVSSGNDASVAMAEYIAGSEGEFVNMMNNEAARLSMNHTQFMDCTGLSDDDNHYSSAHDVAIMTREIITKYPEIKNYSKIWTENIVHKTKKGESIFGLSNTNKLLKSYEYTTGLKTGSTSKAKYCLSATAIKEDVEMIAVIMGAQNHKDRFKEARNLLEYGYNNYYVYKDLNEDKLEPLKIKGAVKDELEIVYETSFQFLCEKNIKDTDITKKITIYEGIDLPVKKYDVIGKAEYFYGEKLLGEVKIIANENAEKKEYKNYISKVIEMFFR